MQEPDPEVIRAATRGDLDAFSELVRAFQEPVWRYLCTMTANPAEAEDLAQETFLRAFDHVGSFGFRSKFSTWLFRIAHNLAVDALRRRDRRRLLPARIGPDQHDPGPALSTELEAALATLSPKLRSALLLVEVLGFTCRDAGQLLDIPEGTVKSRLFHARNELVAWFETGESEAADDV